MSCILYRHATTFNLFWCFNEKILLEDAMLCMSWCVCVQPFVTNTCCCFFSLSLSYNSIIFNGRCYLGNSSHWMLLISFNVFIHIWIDICVCTESISFLNENDRTTLSLCCHLISQHEFINWELWFGMSFSFGLSPLSKFILKKKIHQTVRNEKNKA